VSGSDIDQQLLIDSRSTWCFYDRIHLTFTVLLLIETFRTQLSRDFRYWHSIRDVF